MLSRQAQLSRRPAGPVARSLSVAAVALCAAAVFLLAGCGEGDRDDDGSGGSTGTGSAGTELTATLDLDGSGPKPAQEAELACPGDDACDAVEQLSPSDFDPVPPTQACTEIFGGYEVATIEGELDGEQVGATFNRSNGCEIHRFGAIVPLLKELFPGYEPGASLQP